MDIHIEAKINDNLWAQIPFKIRNRIEKRLEIVQKVKCLPLSLTNGNLILFLMELPANLFPMGSEYYPWQILEPCSKNKT